MTSDRNTSVLDEIASIKQEATERTNLNDFGDPTYEAPLAAWVNDMKNGNINDFGYDFLRRLAVKDLCKRLKIHACLNENPKILDVEIPPVVFITGAARTGSTLLHNLMATHPLCRTLARWELMVPTPPPTTGTYGNDPRIAKLQTSMEPLRGTMLEHLHWVNAHEPEENAWGFFNCTGLLGRGISPLMPTWAKWIEDNDLRPTYREFRKLVQILLWKCPPPEGGHLLLKCVMTTARVHDFAEVFPEASMVFTHRDPFRCLVSGCAVGATIYEAFLQEQPGPLHDDGVLGQTALQSQNAVFQALSGLAKSGQSKVTNVRYADLMNDAVLTTRTAYQGIGMEPPDNLEKLVLGYLEDQRSGKRAKPPKKMDPFGYSADAVWNDETVAEYCEFFGLQHERTRLTDTKSGNK